MKKFLLSCFLVFVSCFCIPQAQDTLDLSYLDETGGARVSIDSLTEKELIQSFSSDVEMADAMRESGKIYVVVAVLAVVFIGIIFYLISIDRKISKMEKENEK